MVEMAPLASISRLPSRSTHLLASGAVSFSARQPVASLSRLSPFFVKPSTIRHPPSLRFLSAVSDGVAPLLLGLTTNPLAPFFRRPPHDAILASRLSCPGPVLRASDHDCSCPRCTRKTRPHCFVLPSIGATPGRHHLCLLPTQPGRQANKKRSGEARSKRRAPRIAPRSLGESGLSWPPPNTVIFCHGSEDHLFYLGVGLIGKRALCRPPRTPSIANPPTPDSRQH